MVSTVTESGREHYDRIEGISEAAPDMACSYPRDRFNIVRRPMGDGITNELQISLDAWNALAVEERVTAFQQLPYAEKGDFFLALSARDQAELILSLSPGERRIWMRLLPPDDATDLIQEAPEEERPGLLALMDDYTRREVVALLAYAEDDAGGLMSPRFARLRPDMNVDVSIAYLRRQAELVESFHYAYVIHSIQHLLGIVPLRRLMSGNKDRTVREVMRTDFVAASEEMRSEEHTSELQSHHDLVCRLLLEKKKI